MWALTVPMLAALSALGAQLSGWYVGLAGTPAWATAVPPVDPALAAAMRNTALAAVSALLLGLVDIEDRPRRVAWEAIMGLVILWLLGVPLSLIVILFLLGVGH